MHAVVSAEVLAAWAAALPPAYRKAA